MEYAIQRCCATAVFLEQYNISTDAVIKDLGVAATDIKEFNCCGYPLKNYSNNASLLAASRNLSLAEKEGLDVMTFCNCCYGNLKYVDHILGRDDSVKKYVNEKLEKEDLRFNGTLKIKHLLEVLYFDVGIDRIKEKIVKKFNGMKIALHYGCHILRPKGRAVFGSPGSEKIFDELVKITGAKLVPWALQTKCCGASMRGVDDDLSGNIVREKLADAKKSGADFICTSCAYCQLNFDREQQSMKAGKSNAENEMFPPSLLFTQLLGLSLGIDEKDLFIENDIKFESYFGE